MLEPSATPTPPSSFYLEQMSADTQHRIENAGEVRSEFAGAPEELASALETRTDALAEVLRGIVTDLHADPETAFAEQRSVALLAEIVREAGLDVEVGVHGLDTAFRSEFSLGSGGRTVGILAEYDALPEIGHACGHNVIAAAAVGAFLALHALAAESPGAFSGRVVLLGTPAEEGHTGKEYLARDGAFDDLDAAIMLHPYGYDLVDQVWLGRRVCTVTYTGIAAHASAEPFMGRNALDAASLLYQGLGLLRQQMIPVDRVHAVIAEGGTRASIIPETARVDLYVRSKYPETLDDLSNRVENMARGAALMAEVGVEIHWDEHPPSLPVRANAALGARWAVAQRHRGRHPLPLGVVPESIAASTDFGNVSYRVPGIHPLLKIADEHCALHTREFAEAAVSPAAMTGAVDGAFGLAGVALDLLVDDELARAVAAEFEAAGGRVDVAAFFDAADAAGDAGDGNGTDDRGDAGRA